MYRRDKYIITSSYISVRRVKYYNTSFCIHNRRVFFCADLFILFYVFRHLHDVLKQANMCSMVGFIDPATVSANSGTIADRSRLVAARLQKTDGEQIFMMPYNPGLVSLTGFCFYDFQ